MSFAGTIADEKLAEVGTSTMWMWTPRQALSIGTTMLGIALVLDGLEVFGRPLSRGAIVVGVVFIVVGGLLIWRWRHKIWD